MRFRHSLKKERLFGLQKGLGIVLASFVLVTGFLIAMIGHEAIRATEIALTGTLADNIAQAVMINIESSVYGPAMPVVNAMAQGELPGALERTERIKRAPVLGSFMNSYPLMDGARVGYDNGDYLVLRRVTEGEDVNYNPPPGSAFKLVHYEHAGGGATMTIFYDADMNELQTNVDTGNFNYDPRPGVWYQNALDGKDPVETGPILTPVSGQPAIVFSQRAADARAVVGVDITLTHLSEFLRLIRPTPGVNIGLFRADGVPIAGVLGEDEPEGWGDAPRAREEMPAALEMGFRRYEAGERGLDIDFDVPGEEWALFLREMDLGVRIENAVVLAIPKSELLDESAYFPRRVAFAALGLLIAAAPILYLSARIVFNPLRKLVRQSRKALENPLAAGEEVVSNVTEIQELANGFQSMQTHIRKMFSITETINAETDFSNLIRRILEETMQIAEANGGLLVLLEDEEGLNSSGVACWDGGPREKRFVHIDLDQIKGLTLPLSHKYALSHDFIDRSDPRAAVRFLAPGFDDPGTAAIDLLSVPLFDRMGEPLGTFMLARRIYSGGESFRTRQRDLVEGLAKTAAIALDNHRLFEKQRELLDAIIRVTTGAIDAKSPHTGNHCARVPVIFQMLLQAACDEKEGPFADFDLDGHGWEEARLAAWLHDWGKVITPDFVIDKGTKLETMNDRIHEIRTRFEVLKRDAEIACLEAIIAGGNADAERAKLESAQEALDRDFEFVARYNIGRETVDEDALEHLRQIGSRTWTRTIDKSLGVSRIERARMERSCAPVTPAQERLLADNPEHLIERAPGDAMPPDNPWGIKIETPRYLYNRGELYNLSVRRGTITDEERYIINDHITQTIIMLDKMPLPGHLRNVPEIAGGHHETMDGKGYPRKLARGEMSWSARMLAVADIFEALTASDRPYKKGNTLSEAVKIMEKFREEKRIDEDVFELFLRAGVHRDYGARHLKPEQNDLD